VLGVDIEYHVSGYGNFEGRGGKGARRRRQSLDRRSREAVVYSPCKETTAFSFAVQIVVTFTCLQATNGHPRLSGSTE
jgi:hypothetical protein